MEEVTQPDSKEDLKFLVEHFRNLANAKDGVIREYRELLERYKPDFEKQTQLKKDLYNALYRMGVLEEEIKKLKKKKKAE